MDYIMGFREATHLLSSFTIPPIPIGADHTYLALSFTGDTTPPISITRTPHTTIHFTHELAPLYSTEVEKGLLLLHPSTPLPMLTAHITSVLQTSAISSFPHTTHTGHTPPQGPDHSIVGMMVSVEISIADCEHSGPLERLLSVRPGAR